ncbi:unnamed protein product [Brachionus calyciflorus]|uniref:Uncharacterized protein n=1 Tax=Brachionus calyciflorus TaxID=104777 RepID=A0A813Z015_9BILA|nr:unnamed protein product [Brachionus calyciflorus]
MICFIQAALMIIYVFGHVNSDFVSNEPCENQCLNVCENIPGIGSECSDVCSNQCNSYRIQSSNDKVKCLILCNVASLDQQTCSQICRPDFDVNRASSGTSQNKKKANSEGCYGNGSEICYKLCRLAHGGSIQTCLCECCSICS